MADWTKVLAHCNLTMARDEIAEYFRCAQREAERQGANAYFRPDYAQAWTAFRDDPSVGSAAALLEVSPGLAAYFEGCAPGGKFYTFNRVLRHIDRRDEDV